VRDELLAWLRSEDPPPSRFLALAEHLGLLRPILPELAALRGIPQAKALPGDALDHSFRTVDALPPERVDLRLAGLLHDVGKATTLRDGHFHGHERVGAEQAATALHRLRLPRSEVRGIAHLIRHHMFAYEPTWTDAAVRRFVKRVGRQAIPDLFALRHADAVASGAREPADGGIRQLRERIASEESAPLETQQLAIDGHDLQRSLGVPPGPELGRLLEALLERVIDDPRLNEPAVLVSLARRMHASEGVLGDRSR
jgi:tRNA nucleotidyltransferase/poly(A) polymerase